MVNKEVIRKRLNKLDEYLAVLGGLQEYTREEFLENPERYGSAERFLQLAVEALIDLGNHVIADLGLVDVDSYADIPSLLVGEGHLEESAKEKWIQMIGFRNILVHEYLDIDREIVYDMLQERLGNFGELRKTFAQFL